MDGVYHLANLLAIVKSEGWDAAFADDALDGGHLSGAENANFQAYREPLRSMRHSLDDAKLCMTSLNNIKARLTNKIRNLQRRCAPLVLEDGIERIPDELLAQIFEAGHEMSEGSDFALRVSHVSHRFRQISLKAPSLWTRISTLHPDDQTKAFLLRSGQSDLQVGLWEPPEDDENYADKYTSSLRLISPHSERCSRLSLGMDHKTLEDLGWTHFPRLQYITDNFNEASKCSQWNMPVLSHLRGRYLDRPPVSFPCLSQLTCIELRFHNSLFFDMPSLGQFLYRALNLRILSLDFQSCSGGGSLPALPPPEPKRNSFHIESLKVVIGDDMTQKLVTSLYDILAYLTASVVDVTLLMNQHPFQNMSSTTFPFGSTIRLQVRQPRHFPLILDELLHNCEIVRSVEFETTVFVPDAFQSTQWSKLPSRSLRNLRFRDCVMFEEKRVEEIARKLLGWEDFESLEFISCHKISKEFLRDLQDEFGERVKWSL